MLDTEIPARTVEQTLVALLNELLTVEYGALFFLPQYLPQAPFEMPHEALLRLGEEELHHFDQTLILLRRLGGRMTTDLPAMHPEPDLDALLSRQARREIRAIDLYAQAQQVARAGDLRALPPDELLPILERLESDERRHLRLIERIREEIRRP